MEARRPISSSGSGSRTTGARGSRVATVSRSSEERSRDGRTGLAYGETEERRGEQAVCCGRSEEGGRAGETEGGG